MSQNSEFQTPRILIFRGGALGDFMLTLPAITALRRRRPEAYIELVGHATSAGLALTTGLIDRLQSLDSARLALYFQKECQLPQSEKEYIRSFDLIVSYLHDPDSVLLKHLQEAGAKNIVAVSPMVKSGHASEHFYNPIRSIIGDKFEHGNFKKVGPHSLVRPRISAGQGCPALPVQTVVPKTWSHFIKCDHGATPPAEQFLLKWPQSLQEEARLRLFEYLGGKQVIIIHPGSGSPAKNWPAEKFARLAKKIRAETPFDPLIIGGEADLKPLVIMRSLLPGFHVLDNLSLVAAASLISIARGFIGNDSGITHLAAALGIPVVALFGPTDSAVWAPRGKNVFIIKSRLPSHESLAEIGVDDVFQSCLPIFFSAVYS